MTKNQNKLAYTVKHLDGAWWIDGLECGPCGPYATKQEAREDARGMVRFYRHEYDQRQTNLFQARSGLPGQQLLFGEMED